MFTFGRHSLIYINDKLNFPPEVYSFSYLGEGIEDFTARLLRK